MKKRHSEEKEKENNNGGNSLKSYAKYSSLAFQMIFIILAGTFAGIKLDQWISFSFPLFKITLPILSVFTALYAALKDFFKKK